MDYRVGRGLEVSRLTLGTVQLGLAYGIANTTGQPGPEEALGILRRAAKAGITAYDTAPGYGTAEELVGRFLGESDWPETMPRPVVITKLPAPAGLGAVHEGQSPEGMRERAFSSLRASAGRLGLSALDLCLLHSPADVTDEAVVSALCAARRTGLVQLIGASVYEPREAEEALGTGSMDAVQIPLNILDQRWRESGILGRLAKAGIVVFARSAFLQGLLLMEPDGVPEGLSEAKDALRQVRDAARDLGATVAELALAYVLAQDAVGSVVIGVERVEQLEESLHAYERARELAGPAAELAAALPRVPPRILDPRQWSERT